MPLGVKEDRTIDSSKQWNVHRLGPRLGADLLAAATAGVVVSPLITIIDRAIIENASSRRTISASLRSSTLTLLRRPHHFLASRAFLLVFALYTGTYLSANIVDTVSSTVNSNSANATTAGMPKFLATFCTNITLCLYKDSQFTRMFGAANPIPSTSSTVATSGPRGASTARAMPARKVPLLTYALFAARDCITVFASFIAPPRVAAMLPDLPDLVAQKMSKASVAQMLVPAACQVFSTPLHLLGLDLYNRPGGGGNNMVPMQERLSKVGQDWAKSCAARIVRIVPAFGVGGVVNGKVRWALMERVA